MQEHTNNKVAIVTGSAKRIGKHIAVFLAKSGWKIVIHCNKSIEKAQALKEEIDQYSESLIIKFDMALDNNYTEIFNEINSKLGKTSLLINNASSFYKDDVLDTNLSQLEEQIRINCHSAIMLSQAFFKANQHDKLNIINFNDSVSDRVNDSFFSYFLSKHLLAYASKIIAAKFAPRCRVNTLNFGFVIPDDHVTLDRYNEFVANTPLQKRVKIEDICNAINFILNSETITGATINIDGGKALTHRTAR